MYSCPYCGRKLPDPISRSQHVRRCPDGPPPGRRRSDASLIGLWLALVAVAILLAGTGPHL